jgi:hypothetical protein
VLLISVEQLPASLLVSYNTSMLHHPTLTSDTLDQADTDEQRLQSAHLQRLLIATAASASCRDSLLNCHTSTTDNRLRTNR